MLMMFGDCVLDPARRELTRASHTIATCPQVFDLLLYLIENRSRVVTKDDLLEAVWRGRIVSESTITSRINAARSAIGDSGREQKSIRTVARMGFRFVGNVTEVLSSADGGAAQDASTSTGDVSIPAFVTIDAGGVPDAVIKSIVAALRHPICLLVIAPIPSAVAPNANVGLRNASGALHAAVSSM